jgi:SAM-dependent methyltransferase
MTNWTAGYVADIGYTFGYYPELNPQRVKLAFMNAGLVCPEFGAACELGFGQGVSTNIHAAASVTHWSGTDFNPAQAGFAQELASGSGADIKLYDQAFDEFANRSDLPCFDYIGLHGIWSWISDPNRAVIVDFIRRKLNVGGVLYVSYNTQPGWAPMVPIRELLTEHAEVMGAPGHGIVPRIDAALVFAEKMLATNPRYAQANPMVAERVTKLKEQNRNYLAHEYFNRYWLPMSFAEMARWLEPAKLNFAVSAHYLDYVDAINLSEDQQALLHEIPDDMFRQSVRDFMVNKQFRGDYWVKGARKLGAQDQAEGMRAQRVVLGAHRSEVSLKVVGALGEASMQEAVYAPILDLLADYKAKSLGHLEQGLMDKGITFAQISQAIIVLIGAGYVHAVQNDVVITKAKKCTDKLNSHLIQKARASADIGHLASPVTGGGIAINRFKQLFLLAQSQGKKHQADWAQFTWQQLATQGQQLVKEGKTLETPEENLAELTAQAEAFAAKQLPVLKALQVV